MLIGYAQRIEYAYTYFHEKRIEPFTSNKLERHIRSTHYQFEQQLFESIYSKLTDVTKVQRDELERFIDKKRNCGFCYYR